MGDGEALISEFTTIYGFTAVTLTRLSISLFDRDEKGMGQALLLTIA